jgi:pheromone shutdown protein TraB
MCIPITHKKMMSLLRTTKSMKRVVVVLLILCLVEASGRFWTSPPRRTLGWAIRACSYLPRGGSNLHAAAPTKEASTAYQTAASQKGPAPPLPDTKDAAYQQQLPVVVATSNVPAWKQALPERLRRKGHKTLQRLQLGNTDIYILGTAHVSNDSSADVDVLLNCLHPSCIFVELCDARVALLEGTSHENATNATGHNSRTSFWEKIKSTQQAQGGSRIQALSTVLLTSVQEDYANELGVELGGEFRCAHAYWRNASTATTTASRPHLILGDRPLYLTLVRAWESLWWWPKTKVLAGLVWSSRQKPNKEEIRKWLETVMQEESDVLTESFQELRKHFPTLYTTIISERDAWLAAKIVQTCRALNSQQPHHSRHRLSLVAIVGAGHVPGICDWLTNKNQTQMQTPEQILKQLVTTRRWANDAHVQREMIPSWVSDVTELNENIG